MRRTQRGVTFIGWLILLIPVAIVGYAGIRLVPVYLNYTKIARSMTQLAQEMQSSDPAQNIRFALEKRLDIEGVTFPDSKDFTIKRDGQAWVVAIEYEDGAPLVSNIALTAKFNKSVRVGPGAE
jgi:hypothetical protein